MEKLEFLKKLRRALSWTFTEEEITDILADYEDFFISGGAEDKDETQICTELGDPAEIARGLAEALEKKRTSPLWFKIFARMLCTAAVGIAGFMISNYLLWRTDTGVFAGPSMLYIAIIVVMWFVLMGFTSKLPPVAQASNKAWKTAFTACHAGLLMFTVLDYSLFHKGVTNTLLDRPLPAVVILYSYILPVVLSVSLLIAVISIFGFYRASPLWFTVISHAFGTAVYTWTQVNILHSLDDPARLPSLLSVIIVYGVSLVLSLLLAAFISRLSRRRA